MIINNAKRASGRFALERVVIHAALLVGVLTLSVTDSWANGRARWVQAFVTRPNITITGVNNFYSVDESFAWGPNLGVTRTSVGLNRVPLVERTANLEAVHVIDNELWTPPRNNPYARARLEFWEETAAMDWWLAGLWSRRVPNGQLETLVTTAGTPSFAQAFMRGAGQAQMIVGAPKDWFYNIWVPHWGSNLPVRLGFWSQGWIDGDYGIAGSMSIHDNVSGTNQTLFSDGFFDNGDGTFSHIGTGWDPQSLVWNPDVDGEGNSGWNLVGHDLSKQETPYEYSFWVGLQKVGEDENFVELALDYNIETYMGSTPIPEPSSLVLVGCGSVAFLIMLRKRTVSNDVKGKG